MSNNKKYKDKTGNLILLDEELGKGKEGTVYSIKNRQNLVAKIYNDETLFHHDKTNKIKAMCDLFDDEIAAFSALPQEAIYNSKNKLVGFIMERVDGFREIHNLYGIPTKRKFFDFADYGFMVHGALNLARAIETLHNKNIIIGDINQKNILIDNKAMIKLVDCDSYQVEYKNKTYYCEVGVPEYTSPELQGRSFKGIKRTENNDCFGLAVMIFQILMFGKHPYSGVNAPSETENSIKQGCYCYGINSKGKTKTYSKLADELFTSEIKELFERAFSKNSNIIRPSAKEWVFGLENFEKSLVKCKKNGKHIYNPKTKKCIWCELKRKKFAPFDKIIRPQKPKNVQTSYSNSSVTSAMTYPYNLISSTSTNTQGSVVDYVKSIATLIIFFFFVIKGIVGINSFLKNNYSHNTYYQNRYAASYNTTSQTQTSSATSTNTNANNEDNANNEHNSGIGVTMKKTDNLVKIVYLTPDMPAYDAGIKIGDAIVEIDGYKINEVPEASAKLRGNDGTPIEVKVLRGDYLYTYSLHRKILPKNNTTSAGDTQSSTPKKINWEPYLKNIEQNIHDNWYPPKGSDSKHAVAFFKIAKDGSILELSIKTSSGDYDFDNIALEAIENASPFEALPAEFEGDTVPIEFTFDYNAIRKTEAD